MPKRAATRGRDAARGGALGIVVACCGLVLAALPIFLVGGLAVQIRAELGFSEAAVGAAVSAALLTGACTAPLGGRIADRAGARVAVLTGSALSVVALAGIAGAAQSWGAFVALLAVSGVGVALTDPGLAIVVARAVPTARQGVAFGVKEASIPIATLTAGLAVPAIALTVGWRWAFLLGVVPLAGLVLLLPRLPLGTRRPVSPATAEPAPPAPPSAGAEPAAPPAETSGQPPPAQPARLSRGTLVLIGVAAALGMAAASGVGVFLTQSAVAMGMAPGAAGLLLAAGSVAGIASRIVTGVVADRSGGQQFGLIAGMLAVGAVAMALGVAGVGPLLVLATVGTFAAGWGWSGLLFLSLVRANPGAPGTAAGIGVAGLASGNGLGPLLFGLLAEGGSYALAWGSAATVALVAAVLMRAARTQVLGGRARGSRGGAP